MLQKAINIAVNNHTGQTRFNGEPFILHPMRIMLRMQTEDLKIIAIMHDVVEDTNVTLAELGVAGFHDRIIKAIKFLTRPDDMTYETYIMRINENTLARFVKLADLEDNMAVHNLPVMEERDHKRIEKHFNAYQTLK